MEVSDEIKRRVVAIRFLDHCGEIYKPNVSFSTRQVADWGAASVALRSPERSDAMLEAQNGTTMYLSANHRLAYRGWNDIARDGRALIAEHVAPSMEDASVKFGLGKEFINSTRWIILGALMEDAFQELLVPPFFFHDVLTIYEDGHLPCGWEGGEWPVGTLLFY